jgi:peptidoglycan/LPS O-acetylase OafA/YrhL
VFDLLGKSSYAFYLIHVGTIDDLFIDYISGHWLVRLVAYTFLSIALYRWVESPLQRLLRAKRDPAPQLATK